MVDRFQKRIVKVKRQKPRSDPGGVPEPERVAVPGLPDLPEPEEVTSYFTMPTYMVDRHLNRLSSSAWKLFTYLNSAVNSAPGGRSSATVSTTYKRIAKATRIASSTMRKYMRELESEGLIKHAGMMRHEAGKFSHTQIITILWLAQGREE